jgi:NAD(P)H-quinone oxidoreductase subunit N
MTAGALAVRMPLEGGFEGRYQRRCGAAGYETMNLTVRGLGDLSAYLTDVHGVRPAHLGKKTTGQGAAVGYTYFMPPIVSYRLESLSSQAKGLVLCGC